MSEKCAVVTDKAPAALGPYSAAIKIGEFVFTSGQIPVDPATGDVPADIEAQTRQSLENVKAVLEAAGSGLERVVKTTVFIQDMGDFAKVNGVYGTYFPGDCPPARSCVEVAKLPKGVLIEIEAIATVK